MLKKMAVFVTIFALAAGSAFAASDWASGASYGDKAIGKLKFGLTNVLLGWTELFTEPYESKSIDGVGSGLVNAIGDTIGGALHLVTFPLPMIDIPLPEGGTDLLK